MPRSEMILVLVQGLNMFAWMGWLGALSVGGYMATKAFVALPPKQGRMALEHFARTAEPVVIGASFIVIASTITTHTLFGPIDSIWSLYATWYGRTAMVAFVLAVLMFVRSRRRLAKLASLLWDQNVRVHPRASAIIRNNLIVDLIGFGAILVCMDLMSVGL